MQRKEEAGLRHERLVAFIHALSDTREARSGVWMEHSYARARGTLPAGAAPRVLLAPPPQPFADDPIDVEYLDPPVPALINSPVHSDTSEDESDSAEEGWEEHIATLAPDVALARLAGVAAEALRALRLDRLAMSGCRVRAQEAVRGAARRLRLALASHRPDGQRWLHATLLAHLPRRPRRDYEQVVAEICRAAPRLAERLGAARHSSPVSWIGPARDTDASGPWLAWVEDTRWQRRLAALVPTRPLRWPVAVSGAPAAWCAATAGALRSALADVLAEAGERVVVVGGAGPGAVLAAWLATSGVGGGVRGLLLIAPALKTAEGSRDSPEDPLHELRLPLLAVCAEDTTRARTFCSRPTHRLLEVRGADGALRAQRSLRRRARLTQDALDAAVADECARWVHEVADGELDERRARRVGSTLGDHTKQPLYANARIDEEEFAHLALTSACAAELPEEPTVTRVTGGTPLTLQPPRRKAGSSPLAAADIMQMPIVFADDDRITPQPAPEAYKRVIVAKRSVPPVLVRRR